MNVTGKFAESAVTLLSMAVHVLNPDAARQACDEEAILQQDEVRPKHGWVATERPNGQRWYTHVVRDGDGFEIKGRSSPQPPEGIDPADIPVVSMGSGFSLEHRMLQTKRLLHGFYPGRPLKIGPLPATVLGDLSDEKRLSLLQSTVVTEKTIELGFCEELHNAFLQPLLDYGAISFENLSKGKAAEPPKWDSIGNLLTHFRPVFGFYQRNALVDAPSFNHFRLYEAAVAETGLQSMEGTRLTGGFTTHLKSFDLTTPLQHIAVLLIHLRKCGNPTLPVALADRFREEAATLVEQALDSANLETFQRTMFEAAQAALLAMWIYDDLVTMKHPSVDARVKKSRNIAEETSVRAMLSVMNMFLNLEGHRFANHRHSVIRAFGIGGAAKRRQRVEELVEYFYYYPRFLSDALMADAPVASTDEQILGPAYATEYFRLAGYIE
jgi:hypothetical protein